MYSWHWLVVSSHGPLARKERWQSTLTCAVDGGPMGMGLSLAGGPVLAAEGQVVDVQEQVKKGDQRAGFTLQELVQTPNYTVGAVAIQEEINTHRYADGDHDPKTAPWRRPSCQPAAS